MHTETVSGLQWRERIFLTKCSIKLHTFIKLYSIYKGLKSLHFQTYNIYIHTLITLLGFTSVSTAHFKYCNHPNKRLDFDEGDAICGIDNRYAKAIGEISNRLHTKSLVGAHVNKIYNS